MILLYFYCILTIGKVCVPAQHFILIVLAEENTESGKYEFKNNRFGNMAQL